MIQQLGKEEEARFFFDVHDILLNYQGEIIHPVGLDYPKIYLHLGRVLR